MLNEQLRAADVDRERVVERLRRAQAEGRISVSEFDERLASVYAAKTYGELAVLTADLPAERVPVAPKPAPTMPRPAGWWLPSRFELAAWLVASLVNFLIWGIVSLTTLSLVYPWWIWVAGPWGVVLLVRALGSRLRLAG